jgi:hypothetical protein
MQDQQQPRSEIASPLFSLVTSSDSLNTNNDLEYLLSLIASAAEHKEIESDSAAACWAVAHFCQELQYLPDLREYSTGETIPIGTVPDSHTAAFHRAKDD